MAVQIASVQEVYDAYLIADLRGYFYAPPLPRHKRKKLRALT